MITKIKLGSAAGCALMACNCISAHADFLTDGKADISARNLYFDNDWRSGNARPSQNREWGQGFILRYASGFTEGALGFGVDANLMLGVTLDSGKGRHYASSMFPDDGDRAADYWTRFEPTMKVRLQKTELRYGALTPKLPVLTITDGRLLPQSFEGLQFTSNDLDNATIIGGQLTSATARGSSDSTGLSVAGASQDTNKFLFGGVDYRVGKDLTAQYYFGHLEDFYTQHFLGLLHRLPMGQVGSLTSDLRYFSTRSDGKNSSATGRAEGYGTSGYTSGTNGEIDNNTWSATFTYSLGAHSFLMGYQSVSDDSNFIQPNQGGLVGKGSGGAGVYLYTDRLIQNFIRAGEDTTYVQYGYDFAALGIPGLKAALMYLDGRGIKTAAGSDQTEWERDLSIDYIVPSGALKGVGFGWRNGRSHSEASRDADQNRLIVSYTLALF